jgi:hypothetical protein
MVREEEVKEEKRREEEKRSCLFVVECIKMLSRMSKKDFVSFIFVYKWLIDASAQHFFAETDEVGGPFHLRSSVLYPLSSSSHRQHGQCMSMLWNVMVSFQMHSFETNESFHICFVACD